MRNKLGRKPVRHDVRRLHLAKYLNRSVLPPAPPLNIGYSNVVPGMLCNGPDLLNPPQIPNGIGCCFWAASVRATFARGVSTGKYQSHSLSEAWAVNSVIEAYTHACGFDINNPTATDNGTDPDVGFKYLQTMGIRMPDGNFDKLGVPVQVNPKDFEEVIAAHRLFGGLYVGVEFPDAWEEAQVWDSLPHPNIAGGHEVFAMWDRVDVDGIYVDSWGESHLLTPAGMSQFCDQLTVLIDPVFFGVTGVAINGFDAEQLEADETALS